MHVCGHGFYRELELGWATRDATLLWRGQEFTFSILNAVLGWHCVKD